MPPCEVLAADERSGSLEKDEEEMSKAPRGGFKGYPTDRDVAMKSFFSWIEGKKVDDDIGPYWRVHNKLYDLTAFLNEHPGGKEWLQMTKGTDVTETFESVHVTNLAEHLLPKYYVKDINTPRNSPYTFHEDGFYKTLKRKVRPLLREIGRGPTLKMLLLQDGLITTFAALVITASLTSSYTLAILSGIILGLNIGCSHNFIHQKDSFRMYYLDFSLFSSYEWRITHALSHHSYPNTIYDYEVSAFEPFWIFLPKSDKPLVQRYGAILYEWLLIPWAIYLEILKRMFLWVSGKVQPRIENSFPFMELILMDCSSTPSVYGGISLWVAMHCTSGAWVIFFALAGTHHHPECYHEGDAFREQPDWGLCQLDAIKDKVGAVGNLFMVATSFGDHALHHLFPTVDHSKLKELYPIFFEICREFDMRYDFVTQWELLYGKYIQLAKTTPNPSPPDSRTKLE